MVGKRLKTPLAHRGRTETTVVLEEPETLGAETIQEDEKLAKDGGRAYQSGALLSLIGHDWTAE
jgi:hypothetical protein